MITSVQVSADSADSARTMAVNHAHAMGYAQVEAVFTTVVGDRMYRVQMTVSR